MIVKSRTNDLKSLPSELQDVALTQNDKGIMDISIGKHYIVYALRQDEYGEWYLVHTDTMNRSTLWWMPAALYEVVDAKLPKGWITKEWDDGSWLKSYPSLLQWQVHEGIIDGEKDKLDAYLKEVEGDPTFPKQKEVDHYNVKFNAVVAQQIYEEGVKLARERGWERPPKPE